MKPDLFFLYRQMLRSRRFEEKVRDLWEMGEISGEMHLGMGEEAIAAGLVTSLQDRDAMALDHRGTPALVMRGVSLELLLNEFIGSSKGLCGGFGGHMHLFSVEHQAASSGIVGASGPLAVGFALAFKHLRKRNIAVAFFGEGAVNQGMLLESFNLAVVWKLPVIFVCKDNKLAISTYSPSVTGGNLLARAKAFGMHALEADGTDVEEVWISAGEAINRARNGKGPVFLLAHCHHLEGHFLGDPLLRIIRRPVHHMKQHSGPLIRALGAGRSAPFLERMKSLGQVASVIWQTASDQKPSKMDPLTRIRERLRQNKNFLERIEKEVEQEIARVVRKVLPDSARRGG